MKRLLSVFVCIGVLVAWFFAPALSGTSGFAFRDAARSFGWQDKPLGRLWTEFHGGFVAVTLALAAVLTVYSFVIYLFRYRSVFSTPSR